MARERVLVTVKTYPTLSRKYGETVCTAGGGHHTRPFFREQDGGFAADPAGCSYYEHDLIFQVDWHLELS